VENAQKCMRKKEERWKKEIMEGGREGGWGAGKRVEESYFSWSVKRRGRRNNKDYYQKEKKTSTTGGEEKGGDKKREAGKKWGISQTFHYDQKT